MTVMAPRWVVPVPRTLVEAARSFAGVVVVEDGLVDGGVGSRLRDAIEDEAAAGAGGMADVARARISGERRRAGGGLRG